MKKVGIIIGIVAGLVLLFMLTMRLFGLGPQTSRQSTFSHSGKTETTAIELPLFIQADWIDLSKVASISKFRSGMGHSFVDRTETCRSMKHYYNLASDHGKPHGWSPGDPPPSAPNTNEGVAIFSPVDGEITSFEEENIDFGLQIRLRPNSHPNFTIRLFHIFPAQDVKPDINVKAGQQIGQIRLDQNTDISVEYGSPRDNRFVSYFEVMPDSILAEYIKRGVTSREEMIISKDARDTKPLECNGQQFSKNYLNDPNFDELVYINGHRRDTN